MLPMHSAVPSPLTEALLSGTDVLLVWGATTSYLVGESSLRRGGAARRRPRLVEPVLFLSGTAVLTLTLLPPFGPVLERDLAGHMVQHMLLVLVVAPLLVLGRPGPRFMRAAGPAAAGRLVQWAAAPGGRWLERVSHSPAVAWTGFAVVLWGWHAPGIFGWAANHAFVHAVQHASLVVAAVLCVRTLTGPPRKRSLSLGGAVVALAATGMHSAVLGALLVFATHPVYAVYADHPTAVVMADQQLAGVLMWVGAAPFFLVGVTVVVLRALREDAATPALPALSRSER
jgi:putative membrane protein